ncbi:MAG: response regulator [Thermoguttaceae bacterium]|jgi:two-component system NtrC family sensor kinase
MNDPKTPLILVVDDEQELLENVANVLTAAGFDCQCCNSARAAIEFAAMHAPDLILSDINLAGYSGLEMCQRIKEDEALADVPVMFLSGAQIPDIIRRSHAVGGTYYLRKPFDPGVLIELIDKALWMPQLANHRARRTQTANATC